MSQHLTTIHKSSAYISFSSSLYHLVCVEISRFLVLLTGAVVGHQPHQGEEVVAAARVLLHLLVDPLRDLRGQDLHQGGRCQSPHRVVLDSAAGQIGVGHEGKVINCPEYQHHYNVILSELVSTGGLT